MSYLLVANQRASLLAEVPLVAHLPRSAFPNKTVDQIAKDRCLPVIVVDVVMHLFRKEEWVSVEEAEEIFLTDRRLYAVMKEEPARRHFAATLEYTISVSPGPFEPSVSFHSTLVGKVDVHDGGSILLRQFLGKSETDSPNYLTRQVETFLEGLSSPPPIVQELWKHRTTLKDMIKSCSRVEIQQQIEDESISSSIYRAVETQWGSQMKEKVKLDDLRVLIEYHAEKVNSVTLNN